MFFCFFFFSLSLSLFLLTSVLLGLSEAFCFIELANCFHVHHKPFYSLPNMEHKQMGIETGGYIVEANFMKGKKEETRSELNVGQFTSSYHTTKYIGMTSTITFSNLDS